MKKVFALCLLLALPMAFASCAGFYKAPVMPASGWVYTDVYAPLSLDVEATFGAKKGMSKAVSVLGLVATGDASLKAAADAGGIRTVKHIDYKFMSVLGVFSEFTTIAYGD